MNLIVDRENALYKIAGATMQVKYGIKTFFKGDKSITEEEIATLEDEAWNIRFAEITTAKAGLQYKPGVTARIEPIPEQGDEEKLFNYASTIEGISIPEIKGENEKMVLRLAREHIEKAIEILRQ